MTREGFTLLVMGWDDKKSIRFKMTYIEAFEAMLAALKEHQHMSPQRHLNHCEHSFQIRRKFADSLTLIECEGSARRPARQSRR
jgi:phage regulator Rha-like protein